MVSVKGVGLGTVFCDVPPHVTEKFTGARCLQSGAPVGVVSEPRQSIQGQRDKGERKRAATQHTPTAASSPCCARARRSTQCF